MLDVITVTISFFLFISLSFPVGYLLVNTFLDRRDSKFSFAPLIPIYLSVGTCAQMLISFLVGTLFVSSLVPNLVAASSVIVIIFQIFKSKRLPSFSLTSRSHATVFLFLLLLVIFSYFGKIAIETQWPPIGDAILHSTFTSLIIYKGHIATSLEPLTKPELSHSFPYPQGYHALAADVSLRLGLHPAETVYLLAIYIASLVSASLFSLTYVLSRSYLISLVPVFSILFLHSEGNYEKWIAAYVWNGPFVQLFAFMAIISLVVALQMSYARKERFLYVTPIIIVIFLALFVTYPSFTYHAIVIVGVYFVVQQVQNHWRVSSFNRLRTPRYNIRILQFLLLKIEHIKLLFNYPEQPSIESNDKRTSNNAKYGLSKAIQEDAKYRPSSKSLKLPIITSIAVVIVFVAIFVVTDLTEFYYRLALYNLDAFDKSKSVEYLNVSLIITDYLSNPLFSIFTFASIISSFLFMLIISKPIPFFISLYALLLSVLVGIGFIYPHRTLPFVMTLFVPVVAYMIHQVAISVNSYSIQKTNIKRNRIYYTITLAFVLVSLGIQAPSVYNQLTRTHGWFLSGSEDFDDMYNTATWIKNNIDTDDLILNDRSYSSLFIHGFSVKNLTYSYLNGFGFINSSEQEDMFRELSTIWSDPYNAQNVRSMLQKYNVKYIVSMPEGGYPDYRNWGGSGEPISIKPFSSREYGMIFNSYPYLHQVYRSGEAFVYSVGIDISGTYG